jgi:hypothetical protein
MNDETVNRLGVVSSQSREAANAAEASLTRDTTDSEGAFEEAYEKIGWWNGPSATPDARALVRDFWLRQGDRGLKWLACRLRGEWNIDLLDGAASLLASAGSASLPAVVSELERGPARDQAEALLKALGWMAEGGVEAPASLAGRLEAVLSALLHHDDTSLREWAARAARMLPRERVVALLEGQSELESDDDVRQAIQAAMSARLTAQA